MPVLTAVSPRRSRSAALSSSWLLRRCFTKTTSQPRGRRSWCTGRPCSVRSQSMSSSTATSSASTLSVFTGRLRVSLCRWGYNVADSSIIITLLVMADTRNSAKFAFTHVSACATSLTTVRPVLVWLAERVGILRRSSAVCLHAHRVRHGRCSVRRGARTAQGGAQGDGLECHRRCYHRHCIPCECASPTHASSPSSSSCRKTRSRRFSASRA